jgi:formylglycine-generating enzyme required for sulfatase activity
MRQTFSEVLRESFRKNLIKPGQAAELTGIPKDTILNWIKGRVKKPRSWRDVVRLAGALRLDVDQTNKLLAAAEYPALAELRQIASAGDLQLFIPWEKGAAFLPGYYQEIRLVGEMAHPLEPEASVPKVPHAPASGLSPKVLKIISPIDMEFARVPKGPFLMGSKPGNPLAWPNEIPQHTVVISRDYWIGCTPVTNAQFEVFIEATQSRHDWIDGWQDKLEHPVVNITWEEAAGFCEWLNTSILVGLPDGLHFRLPTEAEWEKAARGQFGREWPWGNEFVPEYCNTAENGPGETTPAGSYAPYGVSPYTVADMAGNVWEWCADWYCEELYSVRVEQGDPVVDPVGPLEGQYRVLRGGSFFDLSRAARCAFRHRPYPDHFGWNGGFRVAIAYKPEKAAS